ncbi:MAG TPA: hypothetical protein VI248_04920, partial [Kineosporiaceae bacterium]
AYTGTVRYLTRPFGPPVAGLVQAAVPGAVGLPFLLSGALKAGYDLVLWAWFRHIRLPQDQPQGRARPAAAPAHPEQHPGSESEPGPDTRAQPHDAPRIEEEHQR